MPIGAHRKPASASKRAPEASEAQIQRACCQYLDLRGIVYTQTDGERSWNKSGSVRFKRRIRRGWPDLTIVIQGRAVFAEVKTRKGRLSPHQVECHAALEAAGARVYVVRSVDDLEYCIRFWQEAWCE